MAAIFYAPNPNSKIFKGNFPVSTVVKIPAFENFNEGGDNGAKIPSKAAMAIITEVQVQNSETIQFFLTFDDVINFFYFGKGLGNIVIRGLLFSDCEGDVPGINAFYQIIENNRGKELVVSFGTYTFTGVIVNYNVSLASDPAYMAEFQLTLAVIDHSLKKQNIESACR